MRKMKFSGTLTALTLIAVLLTLNACRSKKPVAAASPETVQAVSNETSASQPVEKDSDRDGIIDANDNCPDQAGTSSNKGCPEPVAAQPLNPEPTFNYKNILFEFNSSVLKTSSYPILDEIAREIKKYPAMSFSLNGHSSAEGSLERNMTLSNDRATAVRSYLVSLGIASSILEVKAFGESSPITSNDSEAGRQLNRRVEIKRKP